MNVPLIFYINIIPYTSLFFLAIPAVGERQLSYRHCVVQIIANVLKQCWLTGNAYATRIIQISTMNLSCWWKETSWRNNCNKVGHFLKFVWVTTTVKIEIYGQESTGRYLAVFSKISSSNNLNVYIAWATTLFNVKWVVSICWTDFKFLRTTLYSISLNTYTYTEYE